MTLFLASVAFAIGVSALCSLTEAALYSVRMPYVRKLAESGNAAGVTLARFKQNMERPITAILIVNTVANTGGAAVAGAQARQLFGESAQVWFTGAITLSILLFSEILPKVAGVTYGAAVARLTSRPLAAVIQVLRPLVWLSQQMARVFRPSRPQRVAPEEEVHQLAALSAEEGSILPVEAELVQNVLQLNEVQAKDILTPRTVVFTLDASKTVREVADEVSRRPYSRIPVHDPEDPEDWIGLVLKEDVLGGMARDEFETELASLAKPLRFVPEVVPGHRLLGEFLKRRAHLLGVVDEYGGIEGVVTLEDVIESLIGEEILDETDVDADLRQVARQRGAERLHRAAARSRKPEGDESVD